MIIANFNDFAKIWAMTQGGPGYSTTTLVVYVYRLAFENLRLRLCLGDRRRLAAPALRSSPSPICGR